MIRVRVSKIEGGVTKIGQRLGKGGERTAVNTHSERNARLAQNRR